MTQPERAGAPPEPEFPRATHPDWLGPPTQESDSSWSEEAPAERSTAVKLFGFLLLALALAWLGAAGWTLLRSPSDLTLAEAVPALATLSAPLILLALLWLLFGRTSRRETERFTSAVSALRSESIALEMVLQIVATRLEENHARLKNEAERLMSLGDEAADRLGRVTHYLSQGSDTLERNSVALEGAASAAKVDIGVLLHDLPRAEAQALAVAAAMKDAGLTAHGQAGALEAQLAALAARGREADETLSGAAQRMAAHVAQIESGATTAATSIGDASANMNSAVDVAMNRAADAIEAARAGLEAQSAAMFASIEQSRAAIDRAGEDAARGLAERLELVSSKIETLAGHLAAQDAASQALVTSLAKELAALDGFFAQLGTTGTGMSERLAGGIAALRTSSTELTNELSGGEGHASALIERAQQMAEALAKVAGQLDRELPAALRHTEEQTDRTAEKALALVPLVESVRAASEATAATMAQTDASVGRQREALDALLARLGEGVTGAERQLRSLTEATNEAQGAAAGIVAQTGPELIESLLRVRETAKQAAEHAREAIAAVIPQSAAALGEAGRQALGQAVGETVGAQIGELSELSQRAVETARAASERLTRQMLGLAESTAAIEARFDQARREREEAESDNLSRRVALLIESLNSTAIDVTKILSNDVTDSAWAAYLKGDRGVFTRRAVRLLDGTETREIMRHYEEEPEFREQVNRYIHDFEAMLRRVLAERDGSPLGVTILSSDMGKLYVALAQAIERLR